MDAEIKTKWLAALRSGEYKQGKEQLRSRNDEFCCLGVLCNIISPDGWVESEGGYKHGTNMCMPSKFIVQSVGLSIEDTLSTMNDNGDSFETIADYIEINA